MTFKIGSPVSVAIYFYFLGIPGSDYPIFIEAPETSFLCDDKVDGGYYSDPEAECQAFHICASNGFGGLTKFSFVCPNGTLFNQEVFVCDWWFNVDCSLAEGLYGLNDQYAAEREANSGSQGIDQRSAVQLQPEEPQQSVGNTVQPRTGRRLSGNGRQNGGRSARNGGRGQRNGVRSSRNGRRSFGK